MPKKRMLTRRVAALIISVVLIAAAAAVFIGNKMQRDSLSQSTYAVRDAVLRAAVSCYSTEGYFPSELSYLEESYGLVINKRKYIVSYEAFSENLLPDVKVLLKGQE